MPKNTTCFHCAEPIPESAHFHLSLLGAEQSFCCPGCKAVAQAVVENGLEDYYRYRSEPAEKAQGDEALLEKLRLYDNPVLRDELVVDEGEKSTIQLTVSGIKCAACAWLIEKQCLQVEGVNRIGVDVAANRATVEWNNQRTKLSDILSSIATIGYDASPFQPDSHEQVFKNESKRFLKKLGLSGLLTMQVMMLAFGLYFGVFGDIDTETRSYFHWVSLLLTTPVVFYSGSEFFSRALSALALKEVNMDVPISLAIMIIFGSSCWATIQDSGTVYFESVCMFIFLLLISRFLEHQSRKKAATIAANTNKHIPVTAHLLHEGQEVEALARSLKPGDRVRVKPGETIPVDAKVVSGSSDVDESMLTGEFRHIAKDVGSNVLGGTINQSSVMELRVEKRLQNSVVQEISRLQELALSQKPRIAVLVDNIAKYFVYAVLILAVITYLYWTLVSPEHALLYAVAVLVATCPCALGLATPTALTAAMAKLKEFNIILKSADFLENLPNIDTVIFDKTGTLTEGKFSLTDIQLHDFADNEHDAMRVKAIAASLEAHSEHPIAAAFQNPPNTLLNVEQVKVHTGAGVEGMIKGRHYAIGSPSFIGVKEENGSFNVLLSCDNKHIASFTVKDTIASGTKEFVNSVAHLNPTILSGDAEINVADTAKQLGIQHWRSRCLPKDKLAYIEQLQQQGKRVLMIGDGINDGPVLAQADVSIAVNKATDLAKNAADVIMMRDNISTLNVLFRIAKRTKVTIRSNILWALGYNSCALPLAMTGVLAPWMAVIGMSLSSIIVVFNSTRLLSTEKKPAKISGV
ncbi:heavy metal translocating P-type ATPase [Alteromonas sp. a30]|uniref:heavy metal translocating P-type ATPase n=1 Tax=Alteromonas sp. a30 TaxID=2730917 RepID=UPI002281519C|nr:heavy metal translocating P-type ATPase [Alteromonas sp. a30]MCY7293867.1 cadmium-translocating P-type ATPase [Alteromonas sp. a30]